MLKKSKGPEKMIDVNAGVHDLLAHAGVKSAADLLHGPAAECCLQACECCLQISRPADLHEQLEDSVKKVIGTVHSVR